jgi:hypothetical protein
MNTISASAFLVSVKIMTPFSSKMGTFLDQIFTQLFLNIYDKIVKLEQTYPPTWIKNEQKVPNIFIKLALDWSHTVNMR